MPKSDLGDVCGRFVSSRLSKQTDSSLSNDQQSIEHFPSLAPIATEHSRPAVLVEKLRFTSYTKTPVHDLRQHYPFVRATTSELVERVIMPANNDVLLTTFNNNATNGTNGTGSNHQYRSAYVSCSNGNTNGNHSLSPPSQTSGSSSSASCSLNDSSSLMMNWELLKERGSGLVNLGNTCFINASLQCLANTPPLVQWLLCNSHNQCCRVKLEKQFCLFCEAERIVKLIHSKNSNSSFSSSVGAAANPNNIVRRIKEISTTFKVGRQEDASEFLICLIDKIVDGCLRSSQPPERLRPSSGTSYEQLCHSQTIFHDLFGLVLRSRVVCSRCLHTSDTFEVQYTWIVGVRNHSDLRQSLQQFVCRETLAGENLYRCIKCKQLVQAIKRYTLHKASKVLLINLKRFEFGKNSNKLSHLVRYQEYLNVAPYMSEESSNDQSLNYRLYAVLVHVGASMHSGHYFSYVRSPNNRWYKADDTTMTQCDLNQVLTQHGAYILCYIKETPSSSPNGTNGSAASTSAAPSPSETTSKLVYQNGRLNNSEQQSTITNATFFTPRQVPVQNLVKQTNGQNGSLKTLTSTLTKPSIVTSNGDTTNGSNNAMSTEKRAPIVMRIPKLNYLPHKPVPLQSKPIINTNGTTLSSSKLVHKPTPTPIILSTTKNSNYTISPATSLSSVQSTSSPLKLIIKTSGPSSALNGLASISSSYNHDDDDDDAGDDDDDDDDEHSQPAAKKPRIEDAQISPPAPAPSLPSTDLVHTPSLAPSPAVPSRSSLDERSHTSSPSPTKHRKKKKKKKSHKHHHHHHHHHHHKSHHHHRKRSRRDSSRSRSRSRTSSPSSSTSDEQHQRHRKSKKQHRNKRYSSPSASPSSREPL